jgi:hypothetical protein
VSRFGPSFTAASTRDLVRRGLRGGTVTVVLTGDLVGLVGADGGDLAVPIERIIGLRAGLIHGKPAIRPALRLAIAGEKPLHLFPVRDAADAAAARRSYPDFVRGLAARLAQSDRLDGIEIGSGAVWAVLSACLLAVPTLGMAVVFATTLFGTLPEAEKWIARAVTGTATVGLLWLWAWWWRGHWPRRVRRLEDLDRMLRAP